MKGGKLDEALKYLLVHDYLYRDGSVYRASFGKAFDAAAERDNIFGCQFHPEKSGQVGLQMLKNFGELKNAKNEEGAVYAG